MRKKILIIICVLLGLVSIVAYMSSEKEAVPTRVLLENIGGKVIFDHKYHADLVSCEDCHHENLSLTEDDLVCGSCHGVVGPGMPVLNRMQAFHQLCRGCHEEMGVGPYDDTQCAQCHTSTEGF